MNKKWFVWTPILENIEYKHFNYSDLPCGNPNNQNYDLSTDPTPEFICTNVLYIDQEIGQYIAKYQLYNLKKKCVWIIFDSSHNVQQ